MPKADDYGWPTNATERRLMRDGEGGGEPVGVATAAPHESHAQHSPLPWGVNKYGGIGAGQFFLRPVVMDSRGFSNAEDARANAAFIVRACNSHDALLAALKAFGRYDGEELPLCYDWCHEYGHKVHTPKCIATRAAIAKAEGR